MDSATYWSYALLHGAAVQFVDLTHAGLSQDQIEQIFGDGSVALPEGLTRPKHWSNWEMDWLEVKA